MIHQKPVFHVREIPIYGDAILSPMDGYSDQPFRSLCRELGSAMSYTEFVKVEDILNRRDYVAEKLSFREEERPLVIQVYGDDPQAILEGALKAQEHRPDIIDEEHCQHKYPGCSPLNAKPSKKWACGCPLEAQRPCSPSAFSSISRA